MPSEEKTKAEQLHNLMEALFEKARIRKKKRKEQNASQLRRLQKRDTPNGARRR